MIKATSSYQTGYIKVKCNNGSVIVSHNDKESGVLGCEDIVMAAKALNMVCYATVKNYRPVLVVFDQSTK